MIISKFYEINWMNKKSDKIIINLFVFIKYLSVNILK